MAEIVRIGADVGIIGFVAVGVFILCCVAALAVVGLAGWIIKAIGGHDDKADTTHTH